MNAEFYRAYKRQNPVKYAIKYGDKTPEELASPTQGLDPAPTINMVIKPVKEVETAFSQEAPIAEIAPPVAPPVPQVEKPKKPRKKNV